MSFKLHELLKRDSHYVSNLELCQVRLIDNQNFPWIILVPMRDNIRDIIDFNIQDYKLFNQEVRSMASLMKNIYKPYRLNIATIGNVIPQMHTHIVARFKNDKLFPKTVWGDQLKRYTQAEELELIIKIIKEKLKTSLRNFDI